MKIYLSIACLAIFACVTTVSANDLAFYSGPTNPGWISNDAVKKNVEVIKEDPGIKALFKNIEDFGDGDEVGDNSPLAKWTVEHTGNGQQDVIILACGTCPSGLYEFPNKDPDGSNVENFVEAGNVVINVADWIFYMSYEGGVRSPNNGAQGAANVFDIPGLSFGARVGNMKPTDLGKEFIPSMDAFNSDRPWHVEQFKGSDWSLMVFGEADKNNADPAVAISKSPGKDGTGMIAAMWQSARPEWPEKPDIRGIGVVEFINNWLSENGTFDVEAKNKLATTWGSIKQVR
ncbi:hypothetical protein C6500_21380 [Candidatus Poribacteria bacterium]|nr:MAG: hypothetical protein C6500_21380 [Candidatus Poribacteria bacterium]